MTSATMFVVRSEKEIWLANIPRQETFFRRLVTEGVEIVISSSLYRDIFDEISFASVAPVRLQIVESQREVHRSIAQAEIHVVDAKAVHAIN